MQEIGYTTTQQRRETCSRESPVTAIEFKNFSRLLVSLGRQKNTKALAWRRLLSAGRETLGGVALQLRAPSCRLSRGPWLDPLTTGQNDSDC